MEKSTKTWWIVFVVSFSALVVVASVMKRAGEFDHEPNFLSLKGSPFGRTLAYAMRGPADLYWHRGQIEEHGEVDESRVLQGVEIETTTASLESEVNRMAQEFLDEEAEHEAEAEGGEERGAESYDSLRERLLASLKEMRTVYFTRTNDHGDTPQIMAWRFSEAEKRLKLSHDMDPTNLICYGSYFMFVSEGVSRLRDAEDDEEVIARKQNQALLISLSTIDACMKLQDEPGAMITAASAANDAITILSKSDRAKPGAVEEVTRIFVAALHRYVLLRDESIAKGSWENYSVYRRHEMEEAFTMLRFVNQSMERQSAEAELERQ